jgi:hypothetical protein
MTVTKVATTGAAKMQYYQIPKQSHHNDKENNNNNNKGEGVPLHAMEAHGGRGGIAPTHT